MHRLVIGRFRGWVLLALVAALAAAAVPAVADPRKRLEEIERKQQSLDRKIDDALARKGRLLDRITVVDSERSKAEREVRSLDDRIAELNGDIVDVQIRLDRIQQQLAVLTADLEAILSRLVRRTNVFTDRAVATYKAGPAAYMDALLSSESVSDLVERYAYYESALDADATLLEEIKVLRAETEQQRDLVEAKEEQIAAAKRKLEDDRAEVAAMRARKADALASLRRALGAKRELLAQVESKRRSYVEAQRQLENDASRIESILAARASSSSPAPAVSNGGGRFAWPAAGPVTSGYGWRTHPIFGDRRFHSGIDIGAGYGATVVSGANGVVAFVGVMSGYGNVVVVDHGGGLATTYNHLSSFSVSSGQSVGRGTPVGAVGCSGYCTGPHLHFEVRVSGSPVDPMPYLR